MQRCRTRRWSTIGTWTAAATTGLAIGLVTTRPSWLVPLAAGYQMLCSHSRLLAHLTHRLPPLSLALVLGFAVLMASIGTASTAVACIRAWRFNRKLATTARPLPLRLVVIGARLDLTSRLTYVPRPELAAFCYGLLRPRVAVTAGLVDRLDDEELCAVLAHERHHLCWRDPLRYLILASLGAAGCMIPLIPVLRRRAEARLELAADRAALAVISPGALASALLTVLAGGEARGAGVAALSATEARIAQLAGRSAVPPLPWPRVIASVALFVGVTGAVVKLTAASSLMPMVCALCAHLV